MEYFFLDLEIWKNFIALSEKKPPLVFAPLTKDGKADVSFWHPNRTLGIIVIMHSVEVFFRFFIENHYNI